MILPSPTTARTSLAVIVSRGQSRNPEKRAVESAIVEAASAIGSVRVFDVPHLYDLKVDSDVLDELRGLDCDLLVASWIFPRAAHWLLDRIGVRGQSEPTCFDEVDEDAEDSESSAEAEATDSRVAEMFPRPGRKIYCVDMRSASAEALTEEVQRIATEGDESLPSEPVAEAPIRFEDASTRRWYPVIDFSRCTNCMECIDFCLFGVYGLDGAETILVEQPDNCRKGCPACSRVCPANAIMFPQHKAPAIAGAAVEGEEGFKIDLSLLFGAPAQAGDAIAVAARERDEQLLLAGREAVGLPVMRSHSATVARPKDSLDRLIDDLDQCEL
jgi:NAD-dependent dihydropyrimidine dehydrogenase PreA subunit